MGSSSPQLVGLVAFGPLTGKHIIATEHGRAKLLASRSGNEKEERKG
jgi:hypothetical protein